MHETGGFFCVTMDALSVFFVVAERVAVTPRRSEMCRRRRRLPASLFFSVDALGCRRRRAHVGRRARPRACVRVSRYAGRCCVPRLGRPSAMQLRGRLTGTPATRLAGSLALGVQNGSEEPGVFESFFFFFFNDYTNTPQRRLQKKKIHSSNSNFL
ncbi:hypothetical protein LY78DRAFT_150333 [Colletotrichum sublineola]|nr:hypothetical protein LY78DRAFT_150333 [Colletotrichum sublineola]